MTSLRSDLYSRTVVSETSVKYWMYGCSDTQSLDRHLLYLFVVDHALNTRKVGTSIV